MATLGRRLVSSWVSLGPRFLPFADIATEDLTWSRLLRLSLFQISVGMTLVLLAGTLNRVMIVELSVPAILVGAMLALPLLFAPFRALIGFRSDTHRCELGWRRTPFIWRGTLLQFGGFAIMPFALLVLGGMGESYLAPVYVGQLAAAGAFLLAGAGAHTVQTAGLALATDLTPESSHPKVVGFMNATLLVGMFFSAIIYGVLLSDFSPARLISVIQGTAVVAILLNGIAMWKQETRSAARRPSAQTQPDPEFKQAWQMLCRDGDQQTLRILIAVGCGTLAFAMADILIEPFGGQILDLSVSHTTLLTAVLAGGGLIGLSYATWAIGTRGEQPQRVALSGVMLGIPAFLAIIVALPMNMVAPFVIGNFLLGAAGGIFTHATLTSTMLRAPADRAGLALGAWGGVQATAAGLGMAIAGSMRDGVTYLFSSSADAAMVARADVAGYFSVYTLEIVLLLATAVIVIPLVRGRSSQVAVAGTKL